MSKLRRTFEKKFNEKAQAPRVFSGILGDGYGNVDAGDGKAYVRISGSTNKAVCSSVPFVNNLNVWVGYTSEFPDTLRVLGQQPSQSTEFIDGIGKHADQHEWMGAGVVGGTDVLKVHLQQFLPLMVMPYSGLQVMIYPGIVWVNNGYKLISDTNSQGKPIPIIVDLSQYVCTENDEKYLLVGIDNAGEIEVIEGLEVGEGTLLLSDIPQASITMAYKIAAVRRYNSQLAIVVNRDSVDIVDLRFPMWDLAEVSVASFFEEIGDLAYQKPDTTHYENIATLALGATATAISYYSDRVPNRAIDEDEGTGWNCDNAQVLNAWIYIDLQTQQRIYKWRLYDSGNATEYKVQGSEDATTWVDIVTHTKSSNDETVTFDDPQTYRYFRFWCTAGSGGAWFIYTIELQIYVVELEGPNRLPIGSDGQHLVVDGNVPAWADNTPATSVAVSDLTDVDLTGLADNDVLVFNNSSGTWYPEALVAGTSLDVQELDGLPNVSGVSKLIFPNDSLTDNLDGSVSVLYPSPYTLLVKEVDGVPSVSGVTEINITNGTLTDNGTGSITIDFGSSSTDGAAIHDNEANEISAITEKTTPANDDILIIEDSAASYVKKSLKISNLPSGGTGETDVLMVQVFS